MGVKLNRNGTTSQPRWQKVEVADLGDFEILLKKPSWDDLIRDSGIVGASPEDRIKMLILDWRGVTDDAGAVVPFTLDNAKALCVAEPRWFWELSRHCNLAFAGLSDSLSAIEAEGQRKNSEGPLSGDSRDAALAAANQEKTKAASEPTGQSGSGSGSEGSGG